MKKIIIVLLIYCASSKVYAAAITDIHLSAYTVNIKNSQLLHIYSVKNNKRLQFRHKLLLKEKLIDATSYQNKLAVLLEVSNTYHVIVFNPTRGTVLDNFWSYFTSISPSGRFIVYTKWTGRREQTKYGTTVGVTAVYD